MISLLRKAQTVLLRCRAILMPRLVAFPCGPIDVTTRLDAHNHHALSCLRTATPTTRVSALCVSFRYQSCIAHHITTSISTPQHCSPPRSHRVRRKCLTVRQSKRPLFVLDSLVNAQAPTLQSSCPGSCSRMHRRSRIA
ncbi:hypothetical protein BD324DRAFT_258255 [Kockovaella imperatae]|uniref:Uncharacterized protein n=1 Tax=Kockovaella imperatae TaxID=4999 RepID=A0A1Y1UPX2_9TREE|nr:hypothetical protein BD324DRAFT_258255 [Kockovaella imperatae]ORX40110.1 hypothetical protein BD324DRAFT_258255 [Kockovaella imperatae]